MTMVPKSIELFVYDYKPKLLNRYTKTLNRINDKTLLHRWQPPPSTVYKIYHLDHHDHYFSMPDNNPSLIRSISASQHLMNIMYLVNTNLFNKDELFFNCAFNLYDIETSQVYEARILTTFYLDNNDKMDNLIWDIYIDATKRHIFANTSLIKYFIASVSLNYIIPVYITSNNKVPTKIITHNLPFKSNTTTFLSIDKATLSEYFEYDNNVLELQQPRFTNGVLNFADEPFHCGSAFKLTKQSPDFLNDYSNRINKVHTIRKVKFYKSRLIVVCDMHSFLSSKQMSACNVNIRVKSISKLSYIKDDYIILLLATNPRKSSNLDEYPVFNVDLTASIQKLKHANVTSGQGKKHNRSFGSYYGFGIINKYKVCDGMSFGQFERKKINNMELENQICSNLNSQFTIIMERMNNAIPGIIQAGNDQISSLIDFGRITTTNKKFITETDPSKFIIDKCYSAWLCRNARTELFHQEVDSSYTMIGVPLNVEKLNNGQWNGCYKFQFRWSNIENPNALGIDIALYEGIGLLYNGFGLFHRQVPACPGFKDMNFWNLSMYHNARLFNSISNSINRRTNTLL